MKHNFCSKNVLPSKVIDKLIQFELPANTQQAIEGGSIFTKLGKFIGSLSCEATVINDSNDGFHDDLSGWTRG